MRPAIALLFTIGFVSVLVFIYAVTNRRRNALRGVVQAQYAQVRELNALVTEIHRVARESQDIDPSAALIDTMITNHRIKELS